MLTVQTDFPIAEDSLDHINPYGCVRDNTTNPEYLKEVKNYFNNKQLKVLDIGCAGGQLIIDHFSSGDIAIGLEGSSHALSGAGKNNWNIYKNKNLFLCDAAKPYKIQINDKQIKFDYIQSWEVLEHISEDKLGIFLTNIKNHLEKDGLFCGSIAKTQCSSGNHVSLFSLEKWIEIFKQNGLSFFEYRFKTFLRNDVSDPKTCITFTSMIL
jgi:2-polyprenyl-3-methyl-5-hydroxy-6-metoxy-1,4-benzoquinol methylase